MKAIFKLLILRVQIKHIFKDHTSFVDAGALKHYIPSSGYIQKMETLKKATISIDFIFLCVSVKWTQWNMKHKSSVKSAGRRSFNP